MSNTNEMKNLRKKGWSYQQISDKFGMPKSTIYKRLNKNKYKNYYNNDYQSKKKKVSKLKSTKAVNCGIGLSRETIKMKHDTPSRIVSELTRFLENMQPEKAYEENEVLRICRVSKNDMEYWDQITSTPEYTKYQGYTEKGIRLWALESDQDWLQENVTGYRRAL